MGGGLAPAQLELDEALLAPLQRGRGTGKEMRHLTAVKSKCGAGGLH